MFVDADLDALRYDEPPGEAAFHETLALFGSGRQYSLFVSGATSEVCTWQNATGQLQNTLFFPKYAAFS